MNNNSTEIQNCNYEWFISYLNNLKNHLQYISIKLNFNPRSFVFYKHVQILVYFLLPSSFSLSGTSIYVNVQFT